MKSRLTPRKVLRGIVKGTSIVKSDSQPVDRIRSRKETAAILNISVRTLKRLEPEFPPIPITQRIKGYRDSAIQAFLDARSRVR
jgi:hypothetical protein